MFSQSTKKAILKLILKVNMFQWIKYKLYVREF